jgi:hypothetical protein
VTTSTLTTAAAPDPITAADLLADYDLSPADVRSLYPWAVERIALDGLPCWDRNDLDSAVQ